MLLFNNYIFFFDHGQATSIGSSLVSQPFLWCWDVPLHVKQWSVVFLSPKWSLYCCHLVDLINSNLCLAPKSDLIQLIWDHYRSCPETFVPHVYLVVTWKYTYIHICLYKVCLLIYSSRTSFPNLRKVSHTVQLPYFTMVKCMYIYLHIFGYSVVTGQLHAPACFCGGVAKVWWAISVNSMSAGRWHIGQSKEVPIATADAWAWISAIWFASLGLYSWVDADARNLLRNYDAKLI